MVSKKIAKKGSKGSTKAKKADPLFPSRPRSYRIGGDVRSHFEIHGIEPNSRDLSRFVRWPKYIRIQRQRKVLCQRLKVPPSVNQFSKAIDKNQATELLKLLQKYCPETRKEKSDRLKELAAAKVDGKSPNTPKPPPVLKFGLKHVTQLVEEKRAKLVVIAHDVDPIELVVWLPALCRKMEVPHCIIKSKARLGALVHQKNAAVVALTEVKKEDKSSLDNLAKNFVTQFTEGVALNRKWGGGIMGLKTQAKLEKRRKAIEAELAKKAQAQY